MKIGFVGLGNMGEPIAHNLLKAGHELTVFNRTRSKAATLESVGAKVCDSAGACAKGELIFTMLSDDHAVEAVSDEIVSALGPQTIHVSLSTISTQLSRRLTEQHKKANRHFISACVFGRPPAAQAAQLVVVAAGASELIEKSRPALDKIGRKIIVVGTMPEQANLVKLSGNFMIASILEAMAESCALMRKSGMHQRDFLQLICDDLFPSPILKAYGELMTHDRFIPAGFAMELGLKDLRLVLAAAEEARVPMPLGSLVRDNFISGIARGKGQSDWSALAEVANENAGIKPAES